MSRRRYPGVLALCVLVACGLGYVDYASGYERNLGFFYLLPLIATGLLCARAGACLLAVLCTTVWAISDLAAGHQYPGISIWTWNAAIRFLSFLTVALLSSALARLQPSAPPAPREPTPPDEAPAGLIPYENRLPLANKLGRLLWNVGWFVLFRLSPPFLHAWRAGLLRLFGARVGRRCRIHPSLRVWAPWKLTLGNDCRIEAFVDCYTVDRIAIGDRTIVGRGAYLCSASHDIATFGLPLTHAPITVGSDAWIAPRAFLRPGVTVAEGGVVSPCAVVTMDVDSWTVVAGNPARAVECRERSVDAARATTAATTRNVGIVTYHMVDNQGAVLQTYALQEALQKLGYGVTVINYLPAYMTTGGAWVWPFARGALYANAGILLIKLRVAWAALFGRSRRRSFREFRQHHLRLTPVVYRTLDSLRRQPPACDALVCGSDQIWNPTPRFGVDPVYYLAFGPRACRRVAFAPSFGGPQIDDMYRADAGRLLSGLDSISVRERSGVDLVRELSGRAAAWVPDPTLLLDDYDDLPIRPDRGDYIFLYLLYDNSVIRRAGQILSDASGRPVVTAIGERINWRGGQNVVQLGPREWLGHVAHSACVMTNSLHGTAFSIVFRKTFVTVAIEGRKQSLNERFISILDRLGLSRRFIGSQASAAEIARVLEEPIDWSTVQVRLQAWREEAWAFLRDALAAPPAAPEPADPAGGTTDGP